MPGVPWSQILDVAFVVRGVLEDHGLTAWPKTSGSRGFHIYAPVARRWTYRELRLAAETVAREVERRAPELATSRWWKEERHGVFVDFNQNAKDRTVASAYSVRATPDARVSTPLRWDEVAGCRPESFTLHTVRERFADIDDPGGAWTMRPGHSISCWSWPPSWGPRKRRPRVPRVTDAAGRRCPSSKSRGPRPSQKPKQPLMSGAIPIHEWPVYLNHKTF